MVKQLPPKQRRRELGQWRGLRAKEMKLGVNLSTAITIREAQR